MGTTIKGWKCLRFFVGLLILVVGCGSLDDSDLLGETASVKLTIQNPDENARGTAKAVEGNAADFAVAKADSTVSVTSCVITCGSVSKTLSFSAGAAEVTGTVDCPNNSTVCATCPDSSKTTNSVEFGFTGCTTLSGGTSATIDGKFLNQPTCSGALLSGRVGEDDNTHMSVEFIFNGALTDAQKTTAKGHFEICADNNCSSCSTVDASSDGLLDTKGNPYISCEGGLITPICFKYNTSGTKELKGTGSWGTADGNTKCTCKFGKTQWKEYDNDREFNFCVSGTKDGSTYSKCPSSGVAVGKTNVASNSDGAIAAKGSSCSSANGCASGNCAYSSGSLTCGCAGACHLDGIVTDAAGPSGTGAGSADGSATGVTFSSPSGNCLSPDGKKLVITDTINNIIRVIDFSLAPTSSTYAVTLAGSAATIGSTDGSCITAARFSAPDSCVFNAANTAVFISDTGNDNIRKIDLSVSPCTVTEFAGSAGNIGSTNGTGTNARFNNPSGIVSDANDNLYLTDKTNNAIRKITSGAVVTTLAGGCTGSTDGTGTSACFSSPIGIGIDPSGTFLYVADQGNSSLRKINIATQVVTTLATGQTGINGCTVDPSHTNIYVTAAHAINKINVLTGASTTLAGSTSTAGSANGTGTSATFNTPAGLVIDWDGDSIYVPDFTNNKIRLLH